MLERSDRTTLKQQVMGVHTLHTPNVSDEAGVTGFGEAGGGLPALEKYKVRMIPMMEPGDAAIMPHNTREEIDELMNLYEELRIPHMDPKDVVYIEKNGEPLTHVAAHQPQEVLRDIRGRLKWVQGYFPFIQSERADKLGAVLEKPMPTNAVSSETVNDKWIAQSQLRELGVRVPYGKLVYTPEDAAKFCEELEGKGYDKVVFKLRRAASATGVFVLDYNEVAPYMTRFKKIIDESGVLLDGFIPGKIASPNIQFYIGDSPEEDLLISCSDQILSDKDEHMGNVNAPHLYYANKQVQEMMKKVNNWARAKGYRGIAGTDLLITDEIEGGLPYFMEINGRVNGSTPGALIVDRIHGTTMQKAWGVHNGIAVPKHYSVHDYVSQLQQEGIAYNPETKNGVLLVNGSAIPSHGKAMVVVMEDTNNQVRDTLQILNMM